MLSRFASVGKKGLLCSRMAVRLWSGLLACITVATLRKHVRECAPFSSSLEVEVVCASPS